MEMKPSIATEYTSLEIIRVTPPFTDSLKEAAAELMLIR